jgi:hypothetical protein
MILSFGAFEKVNLYKAWYLVEMTVTRKPTRSNATSDPWRRSFASCTSDPSPMAPDCYRFWPRAAHSSPGKQTFWRRPQFTGLSCDTPLGSVRIGGHAEWPTKTFLTNTF